MSPLSLHWQDRGEQGLTEEAFSSCCTAALPVLNRLTASNPHYANRLGWFAPDRWAGKNKIAELQQLAGRIREDEAAFVVIGIGGSNQAARAAIQALRPGQADRIIWAGNTLSAFELQQVLRRLDQEKSIYINCIAKNFETLEPGITFRVLRHYLENRYGRAEAARRTLATGTIGSTLARLCSDRGYTFVEFPDHVGGRYSVGTSVGLLPMAVAGIDISQMAEGMKAMEGLLKGNLTTSNMALQYACLRNYFYQHGYALDMLTCFEPRLTWLAKWWIQLYAESQGKESKGLYPVYSCNSEDLHATGQFVQQGSPVMMETFLSVRDDEASVIIPEETEEKGADYFDYMEGKDFRDINRLASEATLRAHAERGIPCISLELNQLTAYTLGEVFYFFMFACWLDSELLGVNAFDEPGVDAYKRYMFSSLNRPEKLV